MDFAALTNTVLDFIRQHPNSAAILVFGLAFGESLPFASLVLPFWAVLVGVGAIIALADPLIFWRIVTSAAIGAALGDWLSYWIGYHYHAQLQQMWPLNKYPKLLNSRRSFFKRCGALGTVSWHTRSRV
jgi:membrane protein DedA with SNARE-associated domain